MICPWCLRYQIRRSWADFLVVKKTCSKCQKILDLKLDVKEIPLYQSSLKYVYISSIKPAHESMLMSYSVNFNNVYFPKSRILDFTHEDYLALALNRELLIVFKDFLKLDDLEVLEHFQTLKIIEIRNPDVL